MGATKQPTLRIDSDASQPRGGFVVVCNLDPDLLAPLDRCGQARRLLESILRVNVLRTEMPGGEKLPDIFGRYQVLEGELRFIPYFPFEGGLSYRACFDPRPLRCPELSEMLTLEFSLPKAANALPTRVQHIFPSSDCLPENLLRFYVAFSNSMQRGRAESEIALLGPDGEPAPDVLYRAPVELWDKGMRCLTVLLDPGRLKREVGPNRELGSPLKAGQAYTLAVGKGMRDIFGGRLSETSHKRFRVTEAVRESIAVEQWELVAPVTKSHEPLVLLFPRPLDWALLAHTITVASTDGQLIDGRTVIDEGERRWTFTPTSPWAATSYHVRVAPSLEDVCGNSVIAPFDRTLRPGSDLSYEAASRSIAFQLVRCLADESEREVACMSQSEQSSELKLVVTNTLIVGDIRRSVAFYRDVLGATVLRNGEPTFLRFGNVWLTINGGGGPTDDKPEVVASPPSDPNVLNIFLNLRVTDIRRCYELWSSRGAKFITEPKVHATELRCYMRDPDGYLIEVGQTTMTAGPLDLYK